VSLADAGRAEHEHVLGVRDVPADGELADELLVDAGLELKAEVIEGLHRGEVRDLDAHRDALPLLRPDLLAQDRVEEVEVCRLAARGG
jgi:hypothetical protein